MRFEIMYNKQEFDSAIYEDDFVTYDTIPERKKLQASTTPEIESMKIVTEQIESEEYFLNPGWFSAVEKTIYNVQIGSFIFDTVKPETVYGLMIYAQNSGLSH